MKKSIFIFTLLIFCFFNVSYEYIVIPFKNLNSKSPKSYNFNSITGEQFLEFSTNKLVSSISLGTPYKSLELYLTMDYKLFFIGKGYCLKDAQSFYDPSKSSSYDYNEKLYENPFYDLRNMKIGNDMCTLYNDYNLKSNLTLNKLQLYFGNIADYSEDIFDKDKICGILGFKLHTEKNFYGDYNGFDYILKKSGVDNSSFWTIEFFNEEQKKKHGNNDGYIILGAKDPKYLKDIKNITEDDIEYTYNSYTIGSLEWMVSFNKIYYYSSEDKIEEMSHDFSIIAFNFNNKYYFATFEYFDSIKKNFFDKYITNGICRINGLKEFYLKYKYITCDKQKFNEEKKKFPKLILFSVGLNYTYELTYEDLFMDVNDNILFLMFYDPWNPRTFKFGEKFITKYNFIYQIDQKNIGFINYNKKEEGNNDKDKREEIIENKKKMDVIWIIILSVLVVGIIIGIVVGKKIWDNKRKKRANELVDDDYEYKTGEKVEPIINE